MGQLVCTTRRNPRRYAADQIIVADYDSCCALCACCHPFLAHRDEDSLGIEYVITTSSPSHRGLMTGPRRTFDTAHAILFSSWCYDALVSHSECLLHCDTLFVARDH